MQGTSVKGKRVLVAEDDAACRLFLQIVLKEAGCSFVLAVNGQEAVDRVKEGAFDIVLLDLRMPILDGYEAARTIREQHRTLPIIALTANAMDWVKGKCRHCGMNDYLSKPFEKEQLLEKLVKWCAA